MLGPVANSSARGLVCLLLAGVASANVDLVTVEAPQTDVWVGQKASFYVNLRSKGPFAGAASFSLPQIPRVVIVHVGNPTVSTEDIGEYSWYVQTHEFALFSQAAGKIQVPAFEVRFGGREEVSGPPVDRVEKSTPLNFEVKNPPGREGDAFVVTTEKIDVQEDWDPQPGAAKQGAVFHRTISQSADQVTGMALAPPPEKTPAGIRAYFAAPEVSDKTDRGDFSGARTDVITYVLEQPGKATLPAIKYVWWDPKSERFGSTTLPAATFEVAAAPPVDPASRPQQLNRGALALVAALAVAAGLVAWQWSRLRWLLGEARRRLNPPDRVASRHLLRACRDNDAAAAEQAWIAWQNTQDAAYRPSTELNRAAVNLARRLYGATGEPPWDGEALASAFRNEKATRSVSRLRRSTTLAPLNPR